MTYKTHIPIAATATIIVAVFALPLLASAAISSHLDFGERGPDVVELQQLLALDAAIYPEGLVTGYFGSLTQRAVERYQCRRAIVCSGSPSTTGYGRVGPSTMAAVNADLGSGGVGGSDDVHAPTMSVATIALQPTSAIVGWTTNEDARGRVMYNSSWPFLYVTAPSISESGYGSAHSITISALTPGTTYYFVRESVDISGNVMWSTWWTFTTPTSGSTVITAP
jgi:peptidoglycan hydrolase-like protein with peptidoglycan-binding domain